MRISVCVQEIEKRYGSVSETMRLVCAPTGVQKSAEADIIIMMTNGVNGMSEV